MIRLLFTANCGDIGAENGNDLQVFYSEIIL